MKRSHVSSHALIAALIAMTPLACETEPPVAPRPRGAIRDATGLVLATTGPGRRARREYPQGPLAGHLVGFVGVDPRGLEGVEHYYDSVLSQGDDVELTLRADVQTAAEQAIARALVASGGRWACAIVVAAETGEVLALAQAPAFDPRAFRTDLRLDAAAARNRCLLDMFEPGGAWMPVTLAAALDAGVAGPGEVVPTPEGRVRVRPVTVWDPDPSEQVPITELLSRPSPVAAATLALRLGADRLFQADVRFGVGRRLEFSRLWEAAGILRSGPRWRPSDVASAGFGYTFAVTAVQLAAAYTTLARGGVSIPLRLTRSLDAPSGPASGEQRIVSAEAARVVTRALVVAAGTWPLMSGGTTVDVAAKTSLGQKAESTGGYGDSWIATVAGYAPVGTTPPRVVVLVVIDGPTSDGAGLANEAFRAILTSALTSSGHITGGTTTGADPR